MEYDNGIPTIQKKQIGAANGFRDHVLDPGEQQPGRGDEPIEKGSTPPRDFKELSKRSER